MALSEQPVETIYTHTVGTGGSLKYTSPGKFQPKKQAKQEEKRDYILIRAMRRSEGDEQTEEGNRGNRAATET